jgi:CHAT domain-containing protein
VGFNDYATAALMSRFYEFLANGEPAPRALHNAQLWLRDLSDTEAEAHVDARLALQTKVVRKPGFESR